MSSVQGCSLNPLKIELNCKNATVATIFSAIAAIVAISGVLAILASQGVNIGALNTMGKIGMIGGGVLSGVGGVFLLTILSWILAKVIQGCKKNSAEEGSRSDEYTSSEKSTEKKELSEIIQKQREEIEGNKAHLATVFVTDSEAAMGTVYVKTLSGKTFTFHYTEEATVWDLLEKIGEKKGILPCQSRLLYTGRQLNSSKKEDMMNSRPLYEVLGQKKKSPESEHIPFNTTIHLSLNLRAF